MTLEAAGVSLDLISTLLAMGETSDAYRQANAVPKLFREAGLPRSAQLIAAYLREAAEAARLNSDAISVVEAHLTRLRTEPEARFLAPA